MRTQQIYLLIISLLFTPAAWPESIVLNIRNQAIQAEVAATMQSREQGLMRRKKLCENCGMLFVFQHADRHGFWMKGTTLPLAIAFIAPDGSILGIAEMQANSLDEHYPQGDILYALEMNKGWFSSRGISSKDKVEGLPFSRSSGAAQ